MNRAEPFGGYSVRDRAKRYERAARRPRREWDELSDAIPIGRRRPGVPPSAPPENTPRRRATANPYRVRDRMAEESARRTAADAGRAQRDPPRTAKEHTAQAARGQAYARPRATASPDPRRNSDDIFHESREEDVRRLAAYRAAVRRKRMQKLRIGGIAMLIACLFVLCTFAVVYKAFYIVTEVTVEGTSLYTAEEILAASGFAKGDNLYSFSSRVTEENITLHCPYVRTLKVNRFAPDTVTLTVSEDTAVFYAELYGEVWALSPTLRVLTSVTAEDAAAEGLIRLRLPAIERAVAGRVLVFADERSTRAIREAVSEILSASLRERITTVDLRTPQILKLVCDGRYVLNFGDMQDVSVKLKIAAAVLSDDLFRSDVRATIDLSSTGETSVVLDNQIDPDA